MHTNSTKSVLLVPEGIVSAVAAKSRERRVSMQAMMGIEGRRPPNRNDLAPRLVFEYRKASTLKKATRRLRKAGAIQQMDVKNSVGQFGICGVVLITPDGEIIDGHLLVDTCLAMGVVEVPCLVVGHLSKADIRRLRIALNRIQEKGEWDIAALEAEIKELSLEFGEDLFIPGIEPPVLDGLLLEDLATSEAETQKLEVQAGNVVTALNDVWKLGRHIIACADARNLTFALALLEAHFGAAQVRLNLSDPPFNVRIQGHVTGGKHREFLMASGEMSEPDFHAFLVESLKTIFATLAEGGLALLFMDWRGLKILLNAATEAGFSLVNIVVWAKTNGGMGSLYRSQHEFVVVLKKGSASHINNVELGKHGRYRSNLWTYPGASSLGSEARSGLEDHPTPKPVTLLEDAILDVTNRGDLVFDSFAGSGSTLMAAEKTGRVFCGTELDPLYVDVILRRWSSLTGVAPILVTSGETFKEVEARRSSEQAIKIVGSVGAQDSVTSGAGNEAHEGMHHDVY